MNKRRIGLIGLVYIIFSIFSFFLMRLVLNIKITAMQIEYSYRLCSYLNKVNLFSNILINTNKKIITVYISMYNEFSTCKKNTLFKNCELKSNYILLQTHKKFNN